MAIPKVILKFLSVKGVFAVFFAHQIAQVFHSLKPQGLRIQIPPEE